MAVALRMPHVETDGVVKSAPRGWLRTEGLALITSALLMYRTTHQSWWFVPTLLLLPDLLMVGYLAGARWGAWTYNVGHSYLLPMALALGSLAGHHPAGLAVALLWLAHIGMDRALGYGLKYDDDFQHTHLGLLGHRPATPAHSNGDDT